MSARRGRCLCGAVRFTIDPLPRGFGACHCDMCRRWTGSTLLAICVPETHICFEGRAAIRRFASSSWAERAWCDRCGSSLWYRVPADRTYEIPIGLLDRADDLRFEREIYIDCKPASYAFAGQRARLTRAQTLALYAPEHDEPGPASPPCADPPHPPSADRPPASPPAGHSKNQA